MVTGIHRKLIVALSLAMLAAASAQDATKVVKRVIAAPLPALTLPDRPRIERPLEGLDAATAIPKRAVMTDRDGKAKGDFARASAPLSVTTARLLMWGTPHGTYMTGLRRSILDADVAGDFAERDRLFSIYQPWAEKYLNPDSTTWSRDMLYPGSPGKQTVPQEKPQPR